MKVFICVLLILSTINAVYAEAVNDDLDMSYRRVLPLEQGSNFREIGRAHV